MILKLMTRRRALLAAAIGFAAACAPPPAADTTGLDDAPGESRSRLDELDDLLHEEAAEGFAGSVLVARGDEVIHLAGYGLADREAGVPFGPETVSTIGSIEFTGRRSFQEPASAIRSAP